MPSLTLGSTATSSPPSTTTTEESADGERRAWASGTRLAGIRHALGGDLEAIVAKALAKDPAQRYVSMEALSADLGAYLEGRPVQARRAGTFYRLRRFAMRNRAASLVAVVAFVVGVVALLLLLLLPHAATASARPATTTASTSLLIGSTPCRGLWSISPPAIKPVACPPAARAAAGPS